MVILILISLSLQSHMSRCHLITINLFAMIYLQNPLADIHKFIYVYLIISMQSSYFIYKFFF